MRLEVQLHSVATSALKEGKWSASYLTRFTTSEEPRHHWVCSSVGFDILDYRNSLLPLLETIPKFVGAPNLSPIPIPVY